MLMAPRAATQPRVARPAPDEAPRRIGVLGGTFDPPHVGHLWLAALAADVLDLDRVLFMPAAQPPHKGGRLISKGTDRLLMTRLAIHTDPTFELSALEMERPGPSYTIDSVVELKRLYPDAELFLVMAADSLAQIDTWREPDRLLDEIEWAVGPRVGQRSCRIGRRWRIDSAIGRRASTCSPVRRSTSAAPRSGDGWRPGTPSATLCRARWRSSSSIESCTGVADEAAEAKTLEDRVEIPAEAAELAHRIVEIASDKKGNDIVMLRTAELTSMADFFVIASGRSDRQVSALSGAIVDELRRDGIRPLGIEGRASARWVLLDFGSVIVHVFAPEEREYYGLERLWGKAVQVVRIV